MTIPDQLDFARYNYGHGLSSYVIFIPPMIMKIDALLLSAVYPIIIVAVQSLPQAKGRWLEFG